MQTYGKFQPTGFDPKGRFLPDQHDWLVVPVSRTRDTGAFEESNFETALKLLGGERRRIVEVHRFGHWGPGWFEIIIVNPRAGRTRRIAEDIERSLADYPILDEMDLAEREYEEQCETWENCICSDFEKALVHKFEESELPDFMLYHFESDYPVDTLIESADLDELFHVFAERTNTYWYSNSGGQYIDIGPVVDEIELEDIWFFTQPGKDELRQLEKQFAMF